MTARKPLVVGPEKLATGLPDGDALLIAGMAIDANGATYVDKRPSALPAQVGMVAVVSAIDTETGEVTHEYGLGIADPGTTKIAGNHIIHFSFDSPTAGDTRQAFSKGQLLVTGIVMRGRGGPGSVTFDVRNTAVSATAADGDSMLVAPLVVTSADYYEMFADDTTFVRQLLVSLYVDQLEIKLNSVSGFDGLTFGLICVLQSEAYLPLGLLANVPMYPTVGVAYSRIFYVTGGSAGDIAVTAADLPSGLTISDITGRTFTVGGTATTTAAVVPGDFVVTDLTSGQTGTFGYTLEVVDPLGLDGDFEA